MQPDLGHYNSHEKLEKVKYRTTQGSHETPLLKQSQSHPGMAWLWSLFYAENAVPVPKDSGS